MLFWGNFERKRGKMRRKKRKKGKNKNFVNLVSLEFFYLGADAVAKAAITGTYQSFSNIGLTVAYSKCIK